MFSSLLHAQDSSSSLEEGSDGSYASSGAGDDIPMTIFTDIITASSDRLSTTVAMVAANIEMEDLSYRADEALIKETATKIYNAVLKPTTGPGSGNGPRAPKRKNVSTI